VQKAPIAFRRRPVAAESPQASRALGRERRQKIRPFFSRSSQKCPKSIMPRIARPLRESVVDQAGQNPTITKIAKKEVCIE
jgi:hypothetical protein